jgi:CRISPR-associated endonuclease Cas1
VTGRGIREARFSKVNGPRRIVIFGRGGYASWESFSWLQATGGALAYLSRDGELIATTGDVQGGQVGLLRAQARASGTETAIELTKLVLRAKLEGQRRIVEESFDDQAAAAVIADARAQLDTIDTPDQAMSLEARAAVAFWSCWESEPVRFARTDIVPQHWTVAGPRRSALARTSPRLSAAPAMTIVNLLYGLGEFACTLGLRAHGLHPSLGWLHRDTPYRASASLDVEEAIRPVADRLALDLLRSTTFSKRLFAELPSGQVRLSSSLAAQLAEAVFPLLERAVQPVVEDIVAILAAAGRSRVRVRTRKAPVKRGVVQQRPIKTANHRARVSSACRSCGLILDDPDRTVCDECLHDYDRERTEKLSTAGRATLSAMRASPDDPARSPEATAKKREKSRSTSLAMRTWERAHGRGDPETYEREVLPRIQTMTVPQLMNLTGLSQFHCWKVRKGERRLHARHWHVILRVGTGQSARGSRSIGGVLPSEQDREFLPPV